jgi:hypothetical protein
MIPDATDIDACHNPAFAASRFGPRLPIIKLRCINSLPTSSPFAGPPVIVSLVSILSTISLLGIIMHKTLGGVEQASLGPIIIMFMTATTVLMSIVTMESVWRFLDKLPVRRSYGGPAPATASMVRRGVWMFFRPVWMFFRPAWRFLRSVWRFLWRVKVSFGSRNDIRYNPIDARRIPARRGGLAFRTNANQEHRYARRKTGQHALPV